jgi:CheY-like chemotaxis protein
LDVCAAGRFDVVMTDQAMPGMSGDQATAAAKWNPPATPDQPRGRSAAGALRVRQAAD